MNPLNRSISGSDRDILRLISGTAVAQIIAFLGALLITRIYEPDTYGSYSVFLSISTISANFSSLKFDHGIILAKSERIRTGLMLLCLFSGLTLGSFCFLATVIWADHLFSITDATLIYVHSSLLVILSVTNQVNIAARRFKLIAKASPVLSLLTIVFQLGFGIFSPTLESLAIAITISHTLICTLLIWPHINDLRADFDQIRSRLTNYLFAVFNKFKEFPTYVLLPEFLTIISQFIMPIVLTATYGLEITGLYAFGNRIVRLPIILVGASIGNVFKTQILDCTNRQDEMKTVKRMFYKLISLSTILSAGIYFVVPQMLSIFFLESWLASIPYIKIMTLLVFIEFIYQPLKFIFVYFKKLKTVLFVQSVSVLSSIIGLISTFRSGWEFHDSLILMCGILCVGYMSLVINVLFLSKTYK